MKKNRVRIFLGVIAAAIVIMALAFPVYVQQAGPELDNRLLTVGMGHHIIVIGTPVSAQGADYTCDGVNDHVQIQQAVNALPAGGGQIFILTGDYQWGNAQTVTRAIDNVSIVGVGHSVTFTGDGVTAIFSAGGNNWLFSNLEVDAGGITMGATTDWMWLNLTAAGTYYSVHTEDDEVGDVVGPSSATDNAIVRFDGATGKLIQDYTSDAPTVSDTGDVTMATGKTVDGRDVSVDGAKLDGVEAGATLYPDTGEQAFLDADHTKLDGVEAGATLYPDTGEQAFLDADHTKLDGVEAGADITDATNVAAAGAVMEVDYNTQTILIAITDDTPTALVVGEQAVVGRLTGGNIGALNIGVSDNFIVQIDSGTITATEYARFTANGLESRTEAEFKADFNLQIGVDVQAWDADLDELAGLSDADSNFIVGSATGWVVESGETARASLGFPTDPGADMYLMWDDAPTGELVWDAGGAGDVATDVIWDAKGDLAVGTGSDTADNLPVGTDDYILMADSLQSMGLEWVAPGIAAEIAQVQAAGTGSADTYARSDHIHAINHAITNNHIVTIDGTSNQPVSTDYAKFTENGLEGISYAEVLTDLSGTATTTFDWNGQTLADWGIESGATVDAAPVTGQFFLHTPTGRIVLLQYNGSSWTPIISFGAMTVYVDATDGSNTIDQGGSVDAGAFATVQYAVNSIPGSVGGNVIININDETYNESVVIYGKSLTGSYTITIEGVLTQQATGTLDSAIQGTGATQGSITDTGEFTGYANMLIYANSEYRLIDSVTADVATIVGCFTGVPSGTWIVYDWGTQISGATSVYANFGQQGVRFHDIYLNGSSYAGRVDNNAAATFNRCKMSNQLLLRNGSFTEAYQCYLVNTINQAYLCHLGLTGSKVDVCGSGWTLSSDATGRLMSGSIIDGGGTGISVSGNSCVNCSNTAAVGYARIRNCTSDGINAKQGGQVISTINNQYSGNGTDEDAVSASYGYID